MAFSRHSRRISRPLFSTLLLTTVILLSSVAAGNKSDSSKHEGSSANEYDDGVLDGESGDANYETDVSVEHHVQRPSPPLTSRRPVPKEDQEPELPFVSSSRMKKRRKRKRLTKSRTYGVEKREMGHNNVHHEEPNGSAKQREAEEENGDGQGDDHEENHSGQDDHSYQRKNGNRRKRKGSKRDNERRQDMGTDQEAAGLGKTQSSVDIEEEKVKVATKKLVIWLRNRLRKRLGEVADIEGNLTQTDHEVAHLIEGEKRVGVEREEEIKRKIDSQKKLVDFRLKSAEPDDQIRIVTEQTKKLEQQLEGVTKTYNDLASMHAQLQQKIREAGFSHWLDTRGVLYMPETAVGVLAKSAEVLEPMVAGLSRAVSLDRELASNVEALIPKPTLSPVVTGVVSDIFIIAPVIPIFGLIVRVSFSVQGFTVSHYIFFLCAMFAAQSAACMVLSALLAEEALHYYQRNNEPLMIAGLFATAGIYAGLIFLQTLLSVVDSTAQNLAHLVLFNGLGLFFYSRVFRPAVLSQPTNFPVLLYPMLVILFLYIMTGRNEQLRLPMPFQDALRQLFTWSSDYLKETAEAMQISLLGDRSLPSSTTLPEDGKSEYIRGQLGVGTGYGMHPDTDGAGAFYEDSELEWEMQRRQEERMAGGRPMYRAGEKNSLHMGGSRSSSFSIATTAVVERLGSQHTGGSGHPVVDLKRFNR